MAHYFRWLVPDKVIYFRIVDIIDPTEATQVDIHMNQWLDTSPHAKIHLVIDTTLMAAAPNVPTTMRLTYLRHPKLGYLITNERNPVESFIYNTIGKLLNLSYRYVKQVDDAALFLASVDDSLPSVDDMQRHLKIIQEETSAEHERY